MKLLSLWQPWASFMYCGFKLNETRSWSTSYRGLLAIQAAKNRSCLKEADDIMEAAGFDMSQQTTVGGTRWFLGEVLCIVELVDCVPTESIRDKISSQERGMGDYSDGRYAWITKNCRKLTPTIPYRGTQGLRGISSEGYDEVIKQFPDLAGEAAR